jgi:hypothetical protein
LIKGAETDDALSGPLGRQKVRRVVSERETVVERPWLQADCCPCVAEGVNRVTIDPQLSEW